MSQVCNADNTTIVNLSTMTGNNMAGTLPNEIGAFEDIETFVFLSSPARQAPNFIITGALPASMAKWKKLKQVAVEDGNSFSGPLPALDFASMTQCWLYPEKFVQGFGGFDCPLPKDAVKYCRKGDGMHETGIPIDQADCGRH